MSFLNKILLNHIIRIKGALGIKWHEEHVGIFQPLSLLSKCSEKLNFKFRFEEEKSAGSCDP